jgi:hypothetical protein
VTPARRLPIIDMMPRLARLSRLSASTVVVAINAWLLRRAEL